MSKARALALLISLGVSLATMLVMLATEPRMAIGWDEGYTLGREQRLRDWFRGLRDPARFAAQWRPLPPGEELVQPSATPLPRPSQLDTRTKLLFDRDVLAWFWPFAREEPDGHPPFYALVGLSGDLLAPSWQDLARARLGPILFFAVTAGAIFFFSATRWGLWPAALAAGSWVFQPNLFGHGHFASYDGLLTSLWVLSIIVFTQAVLPESGLPSGRIRWLPSVAFGMVLGCAAATKLTGWFVPLPFLAWTVLYHSRRGGKTLALGLIIAIAVLFALMPPWWNEPVGGVVRFLDSNLGRGKTIPIKVQFLGTVYNTPIQSLPWYNTLVWTIFVTPVGFLLMAGLGLCRAARHWRNESIGVLIAGHWVFLMILRGMPHTPGHDGVRLFLPAFGLLALLGGLGARFLLDACRRWAKVVIAGALLEGVVSITVMMPVPLSYFSPIVGGLPGAAALGMEPTYYWDALSPEARRWLAEHTSPGRTFAFRGFSTSWRYLRRMGELPRNLATPFDLTGRLQWIVVQNRPGSFSKEDRTLVDEGRPAYTVTKLGVPLVWIFPFSEYERLEANGRR
jgi:4-amino-4-deoxy-L-arabinose transferase-like glycosyltransferase